MRAADDSDRDRIARAQAGDRAAVELLWDAHAPKLYGYLLHTVRDRTLADDLFQSTWVHAIEALPSYEHRGTFTAWLIAIARNECRQHWRSSQRITALDLDQHDVADGASAQSRETQDAVTRALRTLTEDDRELLRLRYIVGLPTNEIARVLAVSPIAARVRIHRARRHARAALTDHHVV